MLFKIVSCCCFSRSDDDTSPHVTVSVLLDGEESLLEFLDRSEVRYFVCFTCSFSWRNRFWLTEKRAGYEKRAVYMEFARFFYFLFRGKPRRKPTTTIKKQNKKQQKKQQQDT